MLDFLHYSAGKLILKQFQLRIFCRRFPLFLLSKEFHRPKLLICYRQNSYLTKRRQMRLNPLDMNLCILRTWAMPHIDGELKHYETI